MPATPVAVTALQTYLKTGKDLRKNGKTLLKHLQDVYNGCSDSSWSRNIPDAFLDSLLIDVLSQLEGHSTTERECIRLIHVISGKALLPTEWKSPSPVPVFRQTLEERIAKPIQDTTQADAWLKSLIETEIEKYPEDHFRVMLGLRSAGAIVETGRVSPSLKKKLAEVCRGIILTDSMLIRVSAPPQADTNVSASSRDLLLKPFRRSTSASSNNLNALNKETERDFIALSEACLICARKSLPESGPVLYEDISVALGALRGELCRLAMAFFLSACQYDSIERVSREFSFRLPAAVGTIELSDTFAARTFVKIMLSLTTGPNDKPFHALAVLIRDERPAVFLLVCSLLSKLPWHWLIAHVLPPRADEQKTERERRQSGGGKAQLVPEIVYRLSEALKLVNRPSILLAACDAIAQLGKARNIWIAEDPLSRRSSDDPFFPLSGKVTSLCLDIHNDAVRLSAASTLAWIGKPTVFPSKLISISAIDAGGSVVVDAALERCKRNPGVEMCDALFSLVWHYKNVLDPSLVAQQVFAVGLVHARTAAFVTFIMLLDWANDTHNIAWELALLGVINTSIDSPPNAATSARLVLRTERVLRFSPVWLCRKEAATALVKLAVIIGEPSRIQVYEILRDYNSFAASTSSDMEIRESIVLPALALFDTLYELFSQKEMNPLAYEAVNRRVLTLCSGLPSSGFSFIVQAKEQLGGEQASEEAAEDDSNDTDSVEKEKNEEDSHVRRGNFSIQRRKMHRDERNDDDDEDDDEEDEASDDDGDVKAYSHGIQPSNVYQDDDSDSDY